MPETATAENLEEPRTPRAPRAPRPAQPNAVPQHNPNLLPANDNAEPKRTIDERIGDVCANLKDKWKSILRYDDPGDAPQGNLLLPPTGPVRAIGNYLDGALLEKVRTITDINEPAGPFVRAAYRTITRPIPFFHLRETITKPGNYLANPARMITSTTRAFANFATRIPRGLEEGINRGFKRPLQNLSRIPLLEPISRVVGWVGKAVGWVSTGAEWVKDKTIGNFDDWVASKQC